MMWKCEEKKYIYAVSFVACVYVQILSELHTKSYFN